MPLMKKSRIHKQRKKLMGKKKKKSKVYAGARFDPYISQGPPTYWKPEGATPAPLAAPFDVEDYLGRRRQP